ncbi:MAG: protein kinase, partial [Deltaproteobacteria bacterium]|nr:protein kinase [Deltaproteobacteria bacterium]
MFCRNCGKDIPDDAKFCIYCGTPTTVSTPSTPPSSKDEYESPIGPTRKETPQELVTYSTGDFILKRFEIIKKIGEGGMGVVYKVYDHELSEEVAMKIMLPYLMQSKKAIARFRQEIKISRKLVHPNIVRTFELGQVEENRYFTMEFVEGENLRAIIQRRIKEGEVFSFSEAYPIIAQICDALSFAHKYTVHRDIKPENILIDQKGQVKISDFGIAKSLITPGLTSTHLKIGTPYYMSPEQAVESKSVDKRADIYSVGVILYEMLTGSIPIGRFKLPTKVNPSLPSEIDKILEKCLAHEPDDRYDDIALLKQDLKKISEKPQIKKLEKSIKKGEIKKKKRDYKLPLVVASIALIVILTSLIFILPKLLSHKKEKKRTAVSLKSPLITVKTTVKPSPPPSTIIPVQVTTSTKPISTTIQTSLTTSISAEEIEKRQKVKNLLVKAFDLYERGNFLNPPNDNAVTLYKKVLSIDKENIEAQDGLMKI